MSDLTGVLSTAIPIGAIALSVVSAIVAAGRGKIKVGAFGIDFDRTVSAEIRSRLDVSGVENPFRHYALLKEYHAQGSAQSRVSFWFSLTFASLGFAVIALGIGIGLQNSPPTGASYAEFFGTASKPIVTIISGTIIDAVAALFFVQSNKARQLMTDFFDKLRTDRKLDESLRLADNIDDPAVASRLKAILALHFVDIKMDPALLQEVVGPLLIKKGTNSGIEKPSIP